LQTLVKREDGDHHVPAQLGLQKLPGRVARQQPAFVVQALEDHRHQIDLAQRVHRVARRVARRVVRRAGAFDQVGLFNFTKRVDLLFDPVFVDFDLVRFEVGDGAAFLVAGYNVEQNLF